MVSNQNMSGTTNNHNYLFYLSYDGRIQYHVVGSFSLPVVSLCMTDSFVFFMWIVQNGKYPSKKTYYDFKVHALITLGGYRYITVFEFTLASIDDREDLRDFAENQLNLVILGDKGYTGEQLLEDIRSKGICLYR